MCGIAGGHKPCRLATGLDAIAHRGPDDRGEVHVGAWSLGHVRLSIQDLSHAGHQPMERGNTVIAFNGELWQPELARQLSIEGTTWTSTGDTEVLARLLDQQGIGALAQLDGMWAVAWVNKWSGTLYLARDRFGEVPLHWGYDNIGPIFASEIAGLLAMGARPETIRWVEPGTVMAFEPGQPPLVRRWYDLSLEPCTDTLEEAQPKVRALLDEGVTNRLIADVPVGALCSGGIDSTAVLFHALKHIPDLRAYTAVMDPKSSDLKMTRLAAEHYGIEITEVVVPPPTAGDLSDVVRSIELPHKAQVEIAWPCLWLARRMQEDGIKVVLSGEGSDELWASYNRSFMEAQRSPLGWHGYRAEMFVGQHRKNFARCNKVFMRHGIECRLPFLHPALVEYGISLPRDSVYGFHWSKKPSNTAEPKRTKEKMCLRGAYEDGSVPEKIVRRDKAAFQLAGGFAKAAGEAVADPIRYYRAEFKRQLQGVKP